MQVNQAELKYMSVQNKAVNDLNGAYENSSPLRLTLIITMTIF